METQLVEILRPVLGLTLGSAIGLGFALMQTAAQKRHLRRQDGGQLKTGWTLVPGSMGRVAYLLVALVLVQAISPALFAASGRWWVSAGVAAGYGALLGWRLLRGRTAVGPVPTGSH